MYKVFISGSISIKKLDGNVAERLRNVVGPDYQILVGDAEGVDSAVQEHLISKNTANVVVYCAGDSPRNNLGNWVVERISTSAKPGTRAFFTEKDIKMAEVCDYGFMIWDTKSPGTLSNVVKLLTRGKYSLVYINKIKTFTKVKNVADFEELLKVMNETSFRKAEEKLKLSEQIGQLKRIQSKLF